MIPRNNKPLYFAPMEGVTDAFFRKTVEDLYPQWSYLTTDFLRVPSAGSYPKKHLIKHFGTVLMDDQVHRSKTVYQILATEVSHIEQVTSDLGELGFDKLDINLGCPSKTVCKRHGGSYLLSDLKALAGVVLRIRKSFKGFFSAKIRVGFKDDRNFLEIIKLLEDLGVQMITVHGRTREQLYKGIANWSYIAEAKKRATIPIIGNGDVWSVQDIQSMYEQTGCDGVMVARGALKKPWLAKEYFDEPLNTTEEIKNFFKHYKSILDLNKIGDNFQLKRFKGLTRYMFDELKDAPNIKRNLYLSDKQDQYLKTISSLST